MYFIHGDYNFRNVFFSLYFCNEMGRLPSVDKFDCGLDFYIFLYISIFHIIQIYSGITCGRVLNGELYTCKFLYFYIFYIFLYIMAKWLR